MPRAPMRYVGNIWVARFGPPHLFRIVCVPRSLNAFVCVYFHPLAAGYIHPVLCIVLLCLMSHRDENVTRQRVCVLWWMCVSIHNFRLSFSLHSALYQPATDRASCKDIWTSLPVYSSPHWNLNCSSNGINPNARLLCTLGTEWNK